MWAAALAREKARRTIMIYVETRGAGGVYAVRSLQNMRAIILLCTVYVTALCEQCVSCSICVQSGILEHLGYFL